MFYAKDPLTPDKLGRFFLFTFLFHVNGQFVLPGLATRIKLNVNVRITRLI